MRSSLSEHETASTFGIIVAGGLSRRMDGPDKTLRPLGGKPILSRLVERLGPQCASIVLSANGDARRFEAFGLPVVADDLQGFPGPLAGLLAGLDWSAESHPGSRWAVSVAGDTPFIPADLVARLQTARTVAGAHIACATSGGRRHGVVALWPIDLRQKLRAFLVDEGLRKVQTFLARYKVAEVEWPIEPFDPFFNANVPRDLVTGEAIARMIQEPDPCGPLRPLTPGL